MISVPWIDSTIDFGIVLQILEIHSTTILIFILYLCVTKFTVSAIECIKLNIPQSNKIEMY